MTDRRKHKTNAHPVKFSREGSETLGRAFGLKGTPISVRSKISGKEGLAYVDDPHVFIEGPHVAGWYRRSDIAKDFLEV